MEATLAAALEREHREIDRGVGGFMSGEGRTALTGAMEALRRHIYLEEAFLFPPLRRGGLVAAIFVMLREHGEIWRTMAAIDADLARSGGEVAALAHCRELLAQLERHNSKEEPTLYPHADTDLSEAARAELRAFLANGRAPDGWVCAGAAASTRRPAP